MRLLHNDSLYMKLNLLVSLLMVQVLNDIFLYDIIFGVFIRYWGGNSLFTMQKANVQ